VRTCSRLAACLFALAFAVSALPAGAQPASGQQQPRIKISYEEPTNAQLRPIYERLKQRAVLEELQAFLAPLRLPRELTVSTAQCGATSVRFRPQGAAIVCYEMVQAIEELAAKHAKDAKLRQAVITGAFIETVLHETARAMFEILEVPIWGREQDAADRLAALIMVQFGEDVARVTIEGTADLFMWSDKKWTGSDFSEPASPQAQRFFNYVCIAYAAAPLQFSELVKKGILPKGRAQRCEGEYEQIRKAFNLRIMPYVDPEALVRLRATSWLIWQPSK
jgi:Putative metallopeptidase